MTNGEKITASASLESRSLVVELRVTVDTDHSQFVSESLLTRLHECAEDSLPVALASVAPQLLRQVIEKCEEQLLRRIADDVSFFSPKNALLKELVAHSVQGRTVNANEVKP